MAPPLATPDEIALPDAAEVIPLWPGLVGPGQIAPIEQIIGDRSQDAAGKDRVIRGVRVPRMAVFRPTTPNGAAVLITPGGGYVRMVIDHEGYDTARWLAARGLTCFVLFYRLPGEGWASGPDTPLIDAQRAIRLIRARAGAYGLDPARVATIGFSAGGHVCADLAARFATAAYPAVDAADALSARPFCAAPIYPVISMSLPQAHKGSREALLGPQPTPALEALHSPHRNIPADPPPHFLCHAEDDHTVPVANTLLLREALRAKGARVETHLFETGGHGFGLRLPPERPAAHWPDLWLAWAREMKLFS
jgi:acetyl esterase/lipase